MLGRRMGGEENGEKHSEKKEEYPTMNN